MELTVFDRLLLRNIIPEMNKWNFDSMKAARVVLESLFTEEEGAKLQIKQIKDGNGLQWRQEDDDGNPIPQEKEVKISSGLQKKIADFLEQLDAQEQLGWSHYGLCEKFAVKTKKKD